MSKSQIVLMRAKSLPKQLFAVRLPKVCAYRKEQFASLKNYTMLHRATSATAQLVEAVRNQQIKGPFDERFSHASFTPEMLGLMKEAMSSAVATLPEPVSSTQVRSIAETILRTAKGGERDPVTLERMALLELQISQRD
jgi:hypothetical protein